MLECCNFGCLALCVFGIGSIFCITESALRLCLLIDANGVRSAEFLMYVWAMSFCGGWRGDVGCRLFSLQLLSRVAR